MKLALSTICFTLLAGCNYKSPSQLADGAWNHGNVMEFDNLSRTYSVYIPTNGDARGLVLVLHGSGDTVEHLISEIEVEITAEENGLIVVAPAGVDNGWNDEDPPGSDLPDDVGFIDALVTEFKSTYPSLPSNKIFAYGFSNGGGLATRLACESRQIRGIGVIGNYYVSISENCQRPSENPVPGWFGVGIEDELVPVESVRDGMSSYVADLTDCQGMGELESVEVADLPDGVECKQIPNCDAARLCEYNDRGHELLPGSFSTAWYFLHETNDSMD